MPEPTELETLRDLGREGLINLLRNQKGVSARFRGLISKHDAALRAQLASALEAQQKAERENKIFRDDLAYLRSEVQRLSGQVEELGRDNWIDACVRDVAELPDRDSPDGWPEAMLVTGPELKAIIRERVAAMGAPAQETPGELPKETE